VINFQKQLAFSSTLSQKNTVQRPLGIPHELSSGLDISATNLQSPPPTEQTMKERQIWLSKKQDQVTMAVHATPHAGIY
jgi:hypothetical protein